MAVLLVACGGTKDTELVDDMGTSGRTDARARDGATTDDDGATPSEDGATPPRDGATPPGDGATPPGDGATPPPPPSDGGVPVDGAIPGATECTNGIDDDGDGQVDGFDAECTGPGDDDESSFATGIPGDNRDESCQDCFFDGNSGAGDDRCRYATECLTGDDPSTAPGGCDTCEVSDECRDNCRGRTPNGCDCFGCCTIHRDDGSTVDVLIGGGCELETIDDVAACPRCVPSTDCVNTCGTCELCPGRTEADLPPECFVPPPGDAGPPPGDGGVPPGDAGPLPDGAVPPPPPPPFTCDDGVAVCTTTVPCPPMQYCLNGCCIVIF